MYFRCRRIATQKPFHIYSKGRAKYNPKNREREITMVTEFTENQQIALAIVPKFTSTLSICALLYALKSFFKDWSKRGKLYHRLFLCLVINDLVRTMNFFVGSWAVPIGEPHTFMASGNDATCTGQAVLFQFGQIVPIYLTSLSFYAYLAVRHDFKDIKMAWAENYIHLVALAFPLFLTIAMIVLNIQGVVDGKLNFLITKLVRPRWMLITVPFSIIQVAQDVGYLIITGILKIVQMATTSAHRERFSFYISSCRNLFTTPVLYHVLRFLSD